MPWDGALSAHMQVDGALAGFTGGRGASACLRQRGFRLPQAPAQLLPLSAARSCLHCPANRKAMPAPVSNHPPGKASGRDTLASTQGVVGPM